MKNEQLYFIAIIPSQPIYDAALELKHHFRDVYGSKAALNSPPHITLHMPFKWKEAKEQTLISGLDVFSKECSSFELEIENFNCFRPRVIFMDVVESEALSQMQSRLEKFCRIQFNLFNANRQDKPFHPHLTLAFRDLKKSKFEFAWEEFRSKVYHASWQVENIALLKHDGKQWNVLKLLVFHR